MVQSWIIKFYFIANQTVNLSSLFVHADIGYSVKGPIGNITVYQPQTWFYFMQPQQHTFMSPLDKKTVQYLKDENKEKEARIGPIQKSIVHL